MKPDYEKQARELAQKLAGHICHILCPDKQGWEEDIEQIILHELNLAQLMEDKARLDWLSSGDCHWSGMPTSRTVITNAMREQEEAK